MLDGVELQKVVLAAIAGDFQLGADLFFWVVSFGYALCDDGEGGGATMATPQLVAPPRWAELILLGRAHIALRPRHPPRHARKRRRTRYAAPAARARAMDSAMRARLPSKSSAHWLRLHVASVATRGAILFFFIGEHSEQRGGGGGRAHTRARAVCVCNAPFVGGYTTIAECSSTTRKKTML